MEDRFHFLHVGRFAEQKNHVGMVKAFAEFHRTHPDADLTLVGSGELFDQVRDQIRSLGLEDVIHTPGQVDNIIELYSNYDAFLLPSHYEGMPITLIEAMASGMPIIASEVGGIPDMLRHDVQRRSPPSAPWPPGPGRFQPVLFPAYGRSLPGSL